MLPVYLAKVYVVSQEEDEEQLADILLFLVAIQGLVPLNNKIL